MIKSTTTLGASLALCALIGGCATTGSQDYLQAVSAGFTGCTPQANQISNEQESIQAFTWNASCKDKVYLCSSVSTGKHSSSAHCAPAVD